MTRRDRYVLRSFAGWSVFVWGVLIRNMLKDTQHGTGFRVVHIGLATVSISFAVATFLVSRRPVPAPRGDEASAEAVASRA